MERRVLVGSGVGGGGGGVGSEDDLGDGPPGALAPMFSEHFSIHLPQNELEFVDIPLETDVPLFVDPYAFKVCHGDWFVDCNDLLIGYFQRLIDAIRRGDDDEAKRLLLNLSEPNEAHLGHSKGRPRGRGVGPLQALDLYERLKSSRAAQTGKLRDLSDCELMIPGISSDKISDIAVNVVREKLVEFTQSECQKYDVPMRSVSAGMFWNPETGDWRSCYAELPLYEGEPIILVPKECVRFNLAADHQEYWRYFVLEFHRQEHLNSNTSLVRTLTSGKRRGERKVTTKDLEALYPCDKQALYEFSEKHPEVLERYREFMKRKGQVPPTDREIVTSIYEALHRPHEEIHIHYHEDKSMTVTNTVHGDNIGGLVGSGGSVNNGDITVFRDTVINSTRIDADSQAVLLKARQDLEGMELPAVQKQQAAEKLQELAVAVGGPTPKPGVIRRLWENVKAVAPTVAATLTAVKVISELLGGGHPTP